MMEGYIAQYEWGWLAMIPREWGNQGMQVNEEYSNANFIAIGFTGRYWAVRFLEMTESKRIQPWKVIQIHKKGGGKCLM